jgi:hypothetical protein
MVRLLDLLRAHGQSPPEPEPCAYTGKRIYWTREDAAGACAKLRDEGAHHTDKGSRLHPYRCGDHWHVGHRTRGGRRRPQEER